MFNSMVKCQPGLTAAVGLSRSKKGHSNRSIAPYSPPLRKLPWFSWIMASMLTSTLEIAVKMGCELSPPLYLNQLPKNCKTVKENPSHAHTHTRVLLCTCTCAGRYVHVHLYTHTHIHVYTHPLSFVYISLVQSLFLYLTLFLFSLPRPPSPLLSDTLLLNSLRRILCWAFLKGSDGHSRLFSNTSSR